MSHRDPYSKGHGQKKNSTKPLPKLGKGSYDDDFAFQLIDGIGSFNIEGLKDFARKVNLHQCNSYAVVAIMGPQSSGKSTLLNHLFGTNFKEMNPDNGRCQTTNGIWLARCPDVKPLTLVMDMEGTDGSERGEDETSFEKQSALFALSVADVVLINMWCQDIGREHAANKPLLRVVFQQVMIQFNSKPRKITMMFVVRDKTKSPESALEAKLKEDIEKIWSSLHTPSRSNNLRLSDFFKVEVVFLPNYEEKEEEFKLKVKELKQRFVNSTAPGGLADTRDQKRPGSDFQMMAQNIWEQIMENKDLDIPAHRVMLATVRCEEIKNELYDSFQMNEDWCNLRKEAMFGFVPDFGKIMNLVLNAYVSKYDEEALYFDEEVANAKREEFLHQLSQLVEPAHQAMANRLRLEHLKRFMEEFDKDSDKQNRLSPVADRIQDYLLEFDKACAAIGVDRAKWDTLKARAKLQRDMSSYTRTKHVDKLASKIRRLYEPKLKQELSDSIRYLLIEETDPTWSKIRERFKSVTNSTLSELQRTLSEFQVDDENQKEKKESIEKYARFLVESKAREESGRVKFHMISKFFRHFKYGYNSWLSDIKNNEEIDRAARDAFFIPLILLAGLVATRLEDGESDDNIQDILFSALLGSGDEKALKDLDSPKWVKVPPARTLITPIKCKQFWKAFRAEAKSAVSNAPEMVQPVQQDVSSDSRQEYLNKFMEAFDKYSDEWNSSAKYIEDYCYGKKSISGIKEEKGNIKIDYSNPASSVHISISPSSPVSTCPETKSMAPKSSFQRIKVEDGGSIEKRFKREDKGKRKVTPSIGFVDKANAGRAGKAGSASELTTGSQSSPTNHHSFDYPFNTFSSPIDGALETDPKRSFWNQAVDFGNLIDRTLMFPFDVEHHKQLSPLQRGHFMETTMLQLISMMRVQNLECTHLYNCLSKFETSGKIKAEMETKIAGIHDDLKDVLSWDKGGSVQKFRSYLDGIEFGFQNGVKQVAYQAKLQFPGFKIDKTKLSKFKVLHKGQLMNPREVPEEEIDEEVDLDLNEDASHVGIR